MPTFREKVAEFIRQLSSNSERNVYGVKSACSSPSEGTFIQKYLSGDFKRNQPEVLYGKTCHDLPVKAIAPLSKLVVSAYTGPSIGLTGVNFVEKAFQYADQDVDFIDDDENESAGADARDGGHGSTADDAEPERMKYLNSAEEIAGIKDWTRPTDDSYGIATTLYECHPITRENAGEPIADAFAVCVRGNSAVMALADGVNWGERSCLAARCAVHGCMDYLNKALYREGGRVETTLDIFICLLRSFHAAHNLILQENGTLTTLCAAVVCQLSESNRFVVCTCNVGDSLAYVYSGRYGVREITQGSHDIYSMRDMRDALGALGPVDGLNPELGNLTVALTEADPGDMVFLTSDGISDNFDPVVGKFALPKKADKSGSRSAAGWAEARRGENGMRRSNSHNPDREAAAMDVFLPVVEAHQRHELTLLRMEDLLRNGVNEGDGPCRSARQLCDQMIDFATKLTVAKRRILEDPDLYKDAESDLTQTEQRMRRKRVGEKLAMVPGKLDHASVVACRVGFRPEVDVTDGGRTEDPAQARAEDPSDFESSL